MFAVAELSCIAKVGLPSERIELWSTQAVESVLCLGAVGTARTTRKEKNNVRSGRAELHR
jgi:hypothetical protein